MTVTDIERSVEFYVRLLHMEAVTFGNGRRALRCGSQKINFQRLGQQTRNHARIGSGDVCLLTNWTPDQVLEHLKHEQVEVLEGPVKKSGANGEITSVYFNDPDGNLIEVSSYSMM